MRTESEKGRRSEVLCGKAARLRGGAVASRFPLGKGDGRRTRHSQSQVNSTALPPPLGSSAIPLAEVFMNSTSGAGGVECLSEPP